MKNTIGWSVQKERIFQRAERKTKPDDQITVGANEFLDAYLKDERSFKKMSENPAYWFIQKIGNLQSRSRKQHIHHLALAYALLIKAKVDDEFRRAIIDCVPEDRRITKQTDISDLIVEQLFTYGGDDKAETRRKLRGLYNRDAHAIRYLMHKEISPMKVEEIAQQKKQGPDAWARLGAKTKAYEDRVKTGKPSRKSVSRNVVTMKVAGKTMHELDFEGDALIQSAAVAAMEVLKHLGRAVNQTETCDGGFHEVHRLCRHLADKCEEAIDPDNAGHNRVLDVELNQERFSRIMRLLQNGEHARITLVGEREDTGWLRVVAEKLTKVDSVK